MNKKIILTLLMSMPLFCFCQDKKQYSIRSYNYYDSAGNQFSTQKTFDHPPTNEDSITFFNESDKTIHQMIDSVHKASEQNIDVIPKNLYLKRKKSIKKKIHN